MDGRTLADAALCSILIPVSVVSPFRGIPLKTLSLLKLVQFVYHCEQRVRRALALTHIYTRQDNLACATAR